MNPPTHDSNVVNQLDFLYQRAGQHEVELSMITTELDKAVETRRRLDQVIGELSVRRDVVVNRLADYTDRLTSLYEMGGRVAMPQIPAQRGALRLVTEEQV